MNDTYVHAYIHTYIYIYIYARNACALILHICTRKDTHLPHINSIYTYMHIYINISISILCTYIYMPAC